MRMAVRNFKKLGAFGRVCKQKEWKKLESFFLIYESN